MKNLFDKFYNEEFIENLNNLSVSLSSSFNSLYKDLCDIDEIFKNQDIPMDLHKKRLLIITSSSYFENMFENYIIDKYIGDNITMTLMFRRMRTQSMSGFKISVIISWIGIFNNELSRSFQSFFDKDKNGKLVKRSVDELNEIRNESSHNGTLSNSKTSGKSLNSIYESIINCLVVLVLLYKVQDTDILNPELMVESLKLFNQILL